MTMNFSSVALSFSPDWKIVLASLALMMVTAPSPIAAPPEITPPPINRPKIEKKENKT